MHITEYRKYFPITQQYTFLDNSGVAPVSTIVAEEVSRFLHEAVNSATFAYDGWMEQVEDTRSLCAELAGCSPEEIAFVKSTSHGISIVASGYPWEKGDNILVFEKEFPSNIYPWMNLESKGVEIRWIKSDEKGFIPLESISKLVDDRTKLVSISSVQFTNGFRINTNELGKYCREKGIMLFVDAIQSMGIVPMDVKKDNIDFISADGHKWLLSPEGTGFFYCSKDHIRSINPPLLGWNSVFDERSYEKIDFTLKDTASRFEEGSMNIMGIIAMGASCRMLLDIGIDNIKERVQSLGDMIIENCNKRGFDVTSPLNKENRAGIVCFRGDFDTEKMKDKLVESGIMVNMRGGSLRISPHFYNNEQDIDALFTSIDELAEKKG